MRTLRIVLFFAVAVLCMSAATDVWAQTDCDDCRQIFVQGLGVHHTFDGLAYAAPFDCDTDYDDGCHAGIRRYSCFAQHNVCPYAAIIDEAINEENVMLLAAAVRQYDQVRLVVGTRTATIELTGCGASEVSLPLSDGIAKEILAATIRPGVTAPN